MTLKWEKHFGEYCAVADKRDDGSYYEILKLAKGTMFYAIWAWPDDKRKRTDGRELWRDVVYDGGDSKAAVAACNEHSRLRCESQAG